MTRYEVRLMFRYPAWDERDGIAYEVNARSKREAIAAARRQADRDGHLVGLAITEYSFRVVAEEEL